MWTHIQYIETSRLHMDYPRYRLRSWPIASGHVEATCKCIGNRMKGANKRWTRAGAEAIAALICDRASGDKRWDNRWPLKSSPLDSTEMTQTLTVSSSQPSPRRHLS